MSRWAVIENGVVVNVAEAEDDFGNYMGWIKSDIANIGDHWDGVTFTTPPPPPPTMAQLDAVLDAVIAQRESARRSVIRNEILAADPTITTLSQFVVAANARATL